MSFCAIDSSDGAKALLRRGEVDTEISPDLERVFSLPADCQGEKRGKRENEGNPIFYFDDQSTAPETKIWGKREGTYQIIAVGIGGD